MDSPEVDTVREDGALVNLFTGMGVPGRDRKLSNLVATTSFLTHQELEELYRNGLIRRYVDEIPEAMLRHRPTIKIAADEDTTDVVTRFETYLKNVGFYHSLREVIQLQRLYGGAVLLLLVDDGLEPTEPVDPRRIRGIRGFIPLSRHEAIPSDVDFVDYSKPTYYRITTNQRLSESQTSVYTNLQVHHTRVARFDGLYLPWNVRSRNTGWGDSVIQVIWDAWQDYTTALHGLSSLMSEGDLLVHQIPGLMQRIAAGGEADIRKRLELNRMSRSVYGTMVVDKEELITNLSRNLTNISSATDPFVRYLQAVTGWPASILMGDSPGGLGKEGRFEERVWASLVEKWQETYVRPSLTGVFSYILASREGPAAGRPPEDWEVHFPSVFTQTDEEKAALRSQIATSDNTYVSLGVLHPMEIRQARFGSAEFSLDTPLNDQITQQLAAKADAQFQTEMLGMQAQQEAILNPPVPPEGDPAAAGGGEATPTQALAARGDVFDSYEASGLRIRVTHTDGELRAGYLVGPDGQRLDTLGNTPLMVFGPHRTRSYKLYRARFVVDDALIDGPYVTGFASLRAARQGVARLFPRHSVAGLSPLPEDELQALRAGWEAY